MSIFISNFCKTSIISIKFCDNFQFYTTCTETYEASLQYKHKIRSKRENNEAW